MCATHAIGRLAPVLLADGGFLEDRVRAKQMEGGGGRGESYHTFVMKNISWKPGEAVRGEGRRRRVVYGCAHSQRVMQGWCDRW